VSAVRRQRSEELFARARELIPGGVNSPARAFGGVGGNPVFISHGRGAHVWDADGNEYIDFLCSWGPLILGHAPRCVVERVREVVGRGSSFGAPTELELRMAELIVSAVPSVEMVRMVNSGTEAVMSAIRLARGYTGRDKVVKMAGGYHGHADGLLARAGSTAATFGLPDSAGVPRGYAADTLTVPYNDAAALREVFAQCGEKIACVIVEPVAGNMGVVPPRKGYLEELREITRAHGALLIFDEVITGFRVAYGGAQELYGVVPDITTLGKVIGGGFPVGAYGGPREIMEHMAPVGPINQAGTLSGNPVAMAAGIATLSELSRDGVYQELEAKAASLAEGLCTAAEEAGVPLRINRVGSMFTCFFNDGSPVVDWETANRADRERYARFFWAMLDQGVYFPPSQMEASFVSLAHSEEDIAKTVRCARQAFAACAG